MDIQLKPCDHSHASQHDTSKRNDRAPTLFGVLPSVHGWGNTVDVEGAAEPSQVQANHAAQSNDASGERSRIPRASRRKIYETLSNAKATEDDQPTPGLSSVHDSAKEGHA